MPTTILPNGMAIASVNDLEALALYHEIFPETSFCRHGITVSDGDCVFDVGANIGLYSIALAQAYRGLTIFAFEPIPQLSALLRENLRRHVAHADVRTFDYGLADSCTEAAFTYDRFASLATTMHADSVERSVDRDAGIVAWIGASVVDLQRVGKLSDRTARRILLGLESPLARPAIVAIWSGLFLGVLARKRLFLRRIARPVRTVSTVMREEGIRAVQLMKIDVEGSEMAVLGGIADDDWPRIHQFVVEVHDVDGRVAAMRALFERRGYHAIVEREDWAIHRLLGISTLYAVRKGWQP